GPPGLSTTFNCQSPINDQSPALTPAFHGRSSVRTRITLDGAGERRRRDEGILRNPAPGDCRRVAGGRVRGGRRLADPAAHEHPPPGRHLRLLLSRLAGEDGRGNRPAAHG